jgi:hypothetical protein
MRENRTRFVLVSQQAFAVAAVAAVGVSAVGVVDLRIVDPDAGAAAGGSLVSAAPVEPTVRTVPLDLATTTGRSKLGSQSRTAGGSAHQVRVVSDAEPVSGYATVGVTWDGAQVPAEGTVTVEVRTLDAGSWSSWQEMHYDADHGPDPAESTAELRQGTEPVAVGDVDDVQVRAVTTSGRPLEGLALAIVDPGEEVDRRREDSGLELSATLTAAKPEIFSRAQWGADERLRDGSPSYGEIHAGFVHHTVNANDYSRAEVPSIIRGIYAYHTQSRGWSDIGYNFLVDRFGRIWEGRAGGVSKPVIGAHTLGYNDDAFAMSAIGNFEEARPSQAVIDAYGRLMAWKLALHDVDASDTRVSLNGDVFRAINGHRDAGSTACPGRYLYAELPEIRSLAARLQREGSPDEPQPPEHPTTDLDLQLSGTRWPDLVVRDRRTHHALYVRTAGQLSFKAGVTAARRWGKVDLVAAPGDLNGDGFADLVARSTSGTTTTYAGSRNGVVSRLTSSTRFTTMDQLTGVGDLDEDGRKDLVARNARTGRLVLYPGRGKGAFDDPRLLARGWDRFDLTTGAGDLDGDGHVDLVARDGGRLYLVRGTGSGVRRPRLISGGGWDAFDVVTGRGDATGDGVPDLLARVRRTGTTYVFPGDGKGGVAPRIGGWSRFAGMEWLALGGQLAASGRPDVVGVSPRGRLRVYPHSGRRNLGAVVDTGTVLDGVDLLLNVGDWNGDGRGDVMTRDASTGTMHFRAGRSGDRLAAPVVARRGFAGVTSLAAAGDMDRDGYPDLVGTGRNGVDRVYPSNGRRGFGTSYVLRPSVRGTGQVGVGLRDGDRTPDTAVRRADGTLWLWSSKSGEVTRAATRLRRYDWVRGLGDLDGDGRADLVTRHRTNGRLYLLPGTTDGFGSRRLIGTGFARYDLGS